MILHYLKIAWRNMLKYKTQSIISILGLTIGVVFFAYGYHWYKFETTFDGFYPNSDRIYKVFSIENSSDRKTSSVPYEAMKKIEEDFPEVEKVAAHYMKQYVSFSYNEENINENNYQYVDENFFNLFPPTLICGSLENYLFVDIDNTDMVITESLANRLFKSPEDAIGKEIVSESYKKTYTIKAVIKDSPPNSNFQSVIYITDFATRNNNLELEDDTKWGDFNYIQLYVQLHKNINKKAFEDKLSDYAIRNSFNPNLLLGICPLTMTKHDLKGVSELFIDNPSFNLTYIRYFLLAGILLLFSSIFNYLNIQINNVVQRAKEMNLRKVTGASLSKLFIQLFTETGLIILISGILSLTFAEIISPIFEQWFYTVIFRSKLINIVLIIILLITLLLYTTLFISLRLFLKKTSYHKSITHFQLHRTLSVGKLSLAIQLIVGTFFIMSTYVFWQQVRFMQTADWGINTNNIIQVGIIGPRKGDILEEIKQLSNVEEVSPTGLFSIGEDAGPFSQSNIAWEGRPSDFYPFFQVVDVSPNFAPFFGIDIIDGRNLNEADRSSSIPKGLINEEALRIIQLDNPIGKKIIIDADFHTIDGRPGRDTLEIIGVFKDFHGISLRNKIMPMVLKNVSSWRESIFYIRASEGTETETLNLIDEILTKHFKANNPDGESNNMIRTMNSLLDDLSKLEQELLKLFTVVALICILISIFGIYSVSQQETQRRKKEIAIRKTAGAKTKEIMNLFFREYLFITLIASSIALPLAWLFMNRWLQTFAYHTSITWWMFVLVILLVSSIVIITIFSQVYRASNQNPAEVVKSE